MLSAWYGNKKLHVHEGPEKLQNATVSARQSALTERQELLFITIDSARKGELQ